MRGIGYLPLPATQAQSPSTGTPAAGKEQQEPVLRWWCQQEGHQLVGLERDRVDSPRAGSLGGELARRPGLCRALAAVEHGMADALVMHEAARLSLGPIIAVIIGHQLARHHRVLLVVPPEALGEVDPDYAETLEDAVWFRESLKQDLEQMLEALTDYQSALREARRAVGRYAGGAPGYGQRAESGRLVDAPEEQAAVIRARQLHREGSSLRQIAQVLATEGYRPKRGEQWHPTTVARLLNRADRQ